MAAMAAAALGAPAALRRPLAARPRHSSGLRAPAPLRSPLVPCAMGQAGFASSRGNSLEASFRAASQRGAVQPAAAAAAGGAEPAPAAAAPAPAKPPSKPRLPALDSLRFFLIAYIAVGHFVAFATRDPFLLKLLTQVNVWVGPFFVLSGYMAGYTATELGKYEASARVKPAWAYTVARVAGFYPLFILVQAIFAPMFAFADATYNGPWATAAHALMSAGLVQAWFPAHAEIWNAPTWFLSALAFAMLVVPYALPAISEMRRRGLKLLLAALTGISLLGKLAYSYDLNAWALLEGVTSARAHPNLMMWNHTRFHPFYALVEVLIGVAACRLVMIDGVDDEGKPTGDAPKKPGSALLPALGLLGITYARAAGYLPLNDPLTRVLLFVPLFTLLVQRLHRQTVAKAGGLSAFLSQGWLTYLGALSFPIFIVHGPIGQLFYKKVIATKVWGAVQPMSFFPAFCLIVLAAAAVLNKFFVENKKVGEISGNISKAISKAF